MATNPPQELLTTAIVDSVPLEGCLMTVSPKHRALHGASQHTLAYIHVQLDGYGVRVCVCVCLDIPVNNAYMYSYMHAYMSAYMYVDM